MKGSGVAGTPNTILGDILESLGLTEVADSGFRVTYTPDADLAGIGSGTAKMFVDGKYRTGKGIRGDGSWKFSAGKLLGLDYIDDYYQPRASVHDKRLCRCGKRLCFFKEAGPWGRPRHIGIFR